MNVSYDLTARITPAEFIDLLERSTLGARRPIDEPQTIAGMLEHASVLVAAKVGEQLVGVSRAISDFSYCTYLSDLCVDTTCQGQGIGRELIRLTHQQAGLHTTLILLAAPAAAAYYPRIGMTAHDSCWITKRTAPQV